VGRLECRVKFAEPRSWTGDDRQADTPARMMRMLRRDARGHREPSRNAVISQRGALRCRATKNSTCLERQKDTAFVEKAPPCVATPLLALRR
jgi:hypothetical protein